MINYLTLSEIIETHKIVIKRFGGMSGIRDINVLKSAAMRPQLGYYKDILEQAAAMMESLAINHAFVDGNKRVAFFAVDTFLRINGKEIICNNIEAYNHFMQLFDDHNFKYEQLLLWLRQNVVDL